MQTLEYITYKLIQGARIKDPLITETLNKYDFYIMPVVNPDGKYPLYSPMPWHDG